MPIFDLILKAVVGLVGLILVMRWFVVIPYIWFKYDRKILSLKDEFDRYCQKMRKMPMTQPRLDGDIRQKKMYIDEQLEIVETKRWLFFDRVNLFLSISAVNHKG